MGGIYDLVIFRFHGISYCNYKGLLRPRICIQKKKKVTTVFRGKKIVLAEREEAKEYILEAMMTAEEGENSAGFFGEIFQKQYNPQNVDRQNCGINFVITRQTSWN